MQLLPKLLRSFQVHMMLNHFSLRVSLQCSGAEFPERRESIHGGSPETSLFQSVLEFCTGTLPYGDAHAG